MDFDYCSRVAIAVIWVSRAFSHGRKSRWAQSICGSQSSSEAAVAYKYCPLTQVTASNCQPSTFFNILPQEILAANMVQYTLAVKIDQAHVKQFNDPKNNFQLCFAAGVSTSASGKPTYNVVAATHSTVLRSQHIDST